MLEALEGGRMDEVLLKGEKEISVSFHSPEVNTEGWLEKYSVTISARSMAATVQVENAPYGTNPVDFFERVSNEWQGWNGEKDWASIEGEFSLAAKSDSTGHIEVTTRLEPSFYAPCWSSEVTLVVEAGQLEPLYRKFKAFFYPSSNRVAEGI